MKDLDVETDDPAVLRAVSATEIAAKAKYNPVNFGFITDGKVLPADMFDAFRQGKEMPVPLVIGANSLETPIPPGGRPASMESAMNVYITPEERPLLEPAYGDAAIVAEHLPSDFTFTGTMRSLAKFHMAHAPTYIYRFSAVSASVADKFKGAAHATERMYVFNTLSASNWATAERDQKLATAMSAYWVAFARTHNPNGDAQNAGVRPAWPRYDGIHIIDFTNDGPVPQEDPWNTRLDALAKFTDPRS